MDNLEQIVEKQYPKKSFFQKARNFLGGALLFTSLVLGSYSCNKEDDPVIPIDNCDAIGWIGGGSNGWKTTPGTVSESDYQSFKSPSDVFVDVNNGDIYIADSSNCRISKWDSNRNAIGWIGGGSEGWKTTSNVSSDYNHLGFYLPWSVCLNGTSIYFTDSASDHILKWDMDGTAIGLVGGGIEGWRKIWDMDSGSDYKRFNNPRGIFVDPTGNLYIADNSNYRISKWKD